ncbi:hypothetical protein BU15DRAFT_74747 [Melanogaster broomeanus]|nr:hypothetical protein BU15DRAFT_74747 [Melanogaster broomeanus]
MSSELQPPPFEGFTDSTTPPWINYPQNLFRNWTSEQIRRSKILSSTAHCQIYKAHLLNDGRFANDDDDLEHGDTLSVSSDSEKATAFWDELQMPVPSGTRTQVFFINNISSQVVQMLGTRFRIGPSFFSSLINWIPSRYQEDVKPTEGDHITIVLPFVRVVLGSKTETDFSTPLGEMIPPDEHRSVDSRLGMSLHLHSTNHVLIQDLFAIHMVRTSTSSTILSYHPMVEPSNDSAQRLRSLVLKTGDSTYWSEIFSKSNDPTFLVLVMLWYGLYGWDEAFEMLSPHIDWLEVYIFTTNDIYATQELHKLRATLLYYQQLLQDFRRSLIFLQTTPNPAMAYKNESSIEEESRRASVDLLAKEVDSLLCEVDRLESQTAMISMRLKNLMDLAFAMDNIEERKAATRDSSTMKQISYLTMIFLPASFIASVFGMNVVEINPGSSENMIHYIEATLAVSFVTGWLLLVVQAHSTVHSPGSDIWRRLVWPVLFLWRFWEEIFRKWNQRKGEKKRFGSMV